MNIRDRILTERITDPGQLPGELRARVQADPELTALIEENAALAYVTADCPPAPPWENLRGIVMKPSRDPEERAMRGIANLIPVRPLLALAAVVIAVAAALYISPQYGLFGQPGQAWASASGYVLSYELPGDAIDPRVGDGQAGASLSENPYMLKVRELIQNWTAENGVTLVRERSAVGDEPAVALALKAMMSAQKCEGENADVQVQATLEVLALGLSEGQLDSLEETLKGVDGLGAPARSEATWFHMEQLKLDSTMIEVDGHQFSFPEGTGEEEMERLISDWLIANNPGYDGEVDVTITNTPDNGKQIRIEIRGECE
jgi:hypothetical protein